MTDDLRKGAARIVEMIDNPLEKFDGCHRVLAQCIKQLEAENKAMAARIERQTERVEKLRAVAEAVQRYKRLNRVSRIMCDNSCGCEACTLDEKLEEAGFGDG